MYSDITRWVSGCHICEKYQSMKKKSPMIAQEIPQLPFEKVSVDILDNAGKNYLIVVDIFSKWLEIIPINHKTAENVCDKLRDVFCTHGIPRVIRADNMPFLSQTFARFARTYDIELRTCSPHYHRSNSLAEKGCHTARKILKKSMEQQKDFRDLLREYRNTPLSSLNISPCQLLMSRQIRTLLPVTSQMLQPKVEKDAHKKMILNQERCKQQYDKTALKQASEFREGDKVVIKTNKNAQWEPATVVRIHDAPRSYVVRNQNGREVRRNETHIKASSKTEESERHQEVILPINSEEKKGRSKEHHRRAQETSDGVTNGFAGFEVNTYKDHVVNDENGSANRQSYKFSLMEADRSVGCTRMQDTSIKPAGVNRTTVTRSGRVINPPKRLNM
ncbi:uncharacterized protein K02A2.6-like isoform X2 [Bacillus rossius redtenbacheri]|uniref:uncharacterized protein K02A2.6-like isoform X2 n=1 Tax=Bacillus rossius redtenbacheri TaxID=93214 RepID=UPI002FDDD3EB